jgi:hypothetical protein
MAPMIDHSLNEPCSPACAMHEADAAYMGYADRAELIGFLNELMRVAPEAPAHWRPILHRHLAALGATPVAEIVGTLPASRHWFAAKLRAMLPRIRDEGLYADLRAMLRRCEAESRPPP